MLQSIHAIKETITTVIARPVTFDKVMGGIGRALISQSKTGTMLSRY